MLPTHKMIELNEWGEGSMCLWAVLHFEFTLWLALCPLSSQSHSGLVYLWRPCACACELELWLCRSVCLLVLVLTSSVHLAALVPWPRPPWDPVGTPVVESRCLQELLLLCPGKHLKSYLHFVPCGYQHTKAQILCYMSHRVCALLLTQTVCFVFTMQLFKFHVICSLRKVIIIK